MRILELHDLWVVGVLYGWARADGQADWEASVRIGVEKVLTGRVLVGVVREGLRAVARAHVHCQRGQVKEERLSLIHI